MKRLQLNPREQWLSALVISFVILGGYALLRFIPANNEIAGLEEKIKKTQYKLLKTQVSEEPDEDVEALRTELDKIKTDIAEINEMSSNLTQRLAPFDSQSLKLEISQLAKRSKVFIRRNEKMQVDNVLPNQANKNYRKKKQKQKQPSQTLTQDLILPESADWVRRMSPGTLFYRPMQRVELVGSFLGIRQFIHGLSDLSYQVTVVKINIKKSDTEAHIGYP
ncbi:MAG: hypothetical protein K0A92_05165, partial [Methyloprofundus sp.]|nr:hypothetical protein [Methyloprofundus sp.]